MALQIFSDGAEIMIHTSFRISGKNLLKVNDSYQINGCGRHR